MMNDGAVGAWDRRIPSKKLLQPPLTTELVHSDSHLMDHEPSSYPPRHSNNTESLETASLSSVDAIDSMEFKFMDDSSSSSSSSITASGVEDVVNDSNLQVRSLLPSVESRIIDNFYPMSNGSNGVVHPTKRNGHDEPSRIPLPINSHRPSRIPVPTKNAGQRAPLQRITSLTTGSLLHNHPRTISSLRHSNSLDSHPNNQTVVSSCARDGTEQNPINSKQAVQNHAVPDKVSSTTLVDEIRCVSQPGSPNELPSYDQLNSTTSSTLKPIETQRLSVLNTPITTTGMTTAFICTDHDDTGSRLRELLSKVSDSESDNESIAESIYHQPPKAADRNAASRLARRLFNLDGFRVTDVSKHLCKRNDFSQLVGEEFASLFQFEGLQIDVALRSFLNTFSLTGESQERERVLLHFSRRFYACNPTSYPNEDVCHTLICALMLLNTDLHNPGVTRKMTCSEFITNLMQVPGGECLPREQLKTLYNAIKQEPIQWPNFVNLYFSGPNVYNQSGGSTAGYMTPAGFFPANQHQPQLMYASGPPNSPYPMYQYQQQPHVSYTNPMASQAAVGIPSASPGAPFYWNNSVPSATSLAYTANFNAHQSSILEQNVRRGGSIPGSIPYIDLPADINSREYMRGMVARKCVMESHGKKISLGRRGWKVYYARLRDLVLYLYKDAMVAIAAARAEELHTLHHQEQQQQHIALQQQQQQLEEQSVAQVEVVQSDHPVQYLKNPTAVSVNGAVDIDRKEPKEDETDVKLSPISAKPADIPVEVKSEMDSVELTSHPLVGDSVDKQSISSSVDSKIQESAPSLSSTTVSAVTPLQPANTPDIALQSPVQPVSLPTVSSFTPPPIPPPETSIHVAHALASRASDYSKKPNVFRLRTREGAEYLFEVFDAKDLDLWVNRINFMAALLSSPSMPCAVGSERNFYRPQLPVTCTKLNMREQLEEHQRRLIELGRELTDLQKRSALAKPSKSPAQTVVGGSDAQVSDVESDGSTEQTSDPSRAPAGRSINEEGVTSHFDETVSYSESTPTTKTPTSSSTASATSAFMSVFSTASLGRRRKTSSGSLSSLGASTETTCTGASRYTTKQRAEYQERVNFMESEINRYKIYAKLLEDELFRIQQSSAVAAQAAALVAANSFNPYMNAFGSFPATVGGFPQYGPNNMTPSTTVFSAPLPSGLPPPPPRYFIPTHPRDQTGVYTPGMMPLAVLGPQDALQEESTPSSSAVVTESSPTQSTDTVTSAVLIPSSPSFVSGNSRYRGLQPLQHGPQAPLAPFSPSVSGRFYQHLKHWRGPHHLMHYRQQQVCGPFGGSFGRMMNGGPRLTEEDSSSEQLQSRTSSNDNQLPMNQPDLLTAADMTSEAHNHTSTATQFTSGGLTKPHSNDGLFYEIV